MDDTTETMRLDHLGLQVRDLPAAIALFETAFGYRQATEPVVNTQHQVRIVFLEKEGSLPLKLFCPVDDTKPQPPKLHHLCFRVDDLTKGVEALVAKGARLMNPPSPGEAFDGEPIAFLFLAGFNVELIATDKRRGRRESDSGTGR